MLKVNNENQIKMKFTGNWKKGFEVKEKVHYAEEEEEDEVSFLSNFKPVSKDFKNLEKLNSDQITWYIDSGASEHMINYCEEYFTECTVLDQSIKVVVAITGFNLYVTKIGKVTGYDFVNNKKVSYDFDEVLLVPNLEANLFSVSKIFQMV